MVPSTQLYKTEKTGTYCYYYSEHYLLQTEKAGKEKQTMKSNVFPIFSYLFLVFFRNAWDLLLVSYLFSLCSHFIPIPPKLHVKKPHTDIWKAQGLFGMCTCITLISVRFSKYASIWSDFPVSKHCSLAHIQLKTATLDHFYPCEHLNASPNASCAPCAKAAQCITPKSPESDEN